MKLTDLRDGLNTLSAPFYHYDAGKQAFPYGVWGETGQTDGKYADDRTTLQVIGGFVEYYTELEYDPNVNALQRMLNSLGVEWDLDSVTYDYDTQAIFYRWNWSMCCDPGGFNA